MKRNISMFMKRNISVLLVAAFMLSLIAAPALRAPETVLAAPGSQTPDNDFLDRLYNVYMSEDPNLRYRLDKIEYLIPHYENVARKIGQSGNAFRSVEILKDDSPEDMYGNKTAGVDSSLEGRPVYEIRHGDKSGASVIIWSQMHGTESTGTRALMDIFEFLLGENDGALSAEDQAMARALRDQISELNIHFVPMINPDAANNWRRYTMQNMSGRHPYLFVSGTNSFPVTNPGQIDLNRDAWTMESREAKLLWRAFANFDRAEGESQPIFGFTLHDQTSTGVGAYDTPASITMLAVAANGPKYFNDARYRATQIIQKIDMEQIQVERPEMVSRYTDDWGTVYFGDSYVMMGTGMILIETGHTRLDPEKMTLRRTNFKAILRGLWEMAGDYESIDPVDWAPPVDYEEKSHSASVIPKPPSRGNIYDVLLRNVTAPDGNLYNLGINRQMNIIQFDKDYSDPYNTTLDNHKEHRSLWYYSSAYSGQGSERPFSDNLTSSSSRGAAGAKPEIPYMTFNNGYADSRYSSGGSILRYWGNVGYPTNLGMTISPTWPSGPAGSGANVGSNLQTGDSVMFGYEELECGPDGEDLVIVRARVAGVDPDTGDIVFEDELGGEPAPLYDRVSDITLEEAWEILRAGACAVRVAEINPVNDYYNLPLIVIAGTDTLTLPPTISNAANSGQNNFILANYSGEAKYAVIGGYLIDLSQPAAYPTWGVRAGGSSSAVATYDAPEDIDAYEGHFRNIMILGDGYTIPSSTVTVTFDPNGGSVTPDYAETEYGAMIDVADFPTPIWSGHIFNGWFTEPEGGDLVTVGRVYYSDMTIYAQWRLAQDDDSDPYPPYVGGGGGGGGGGLPAVTGGDGSVNLTYTQSGGVVNLTLPETQLKDVIAKSTDKVAVFDLSRVPGSAGVTAPKAALSEIAAAGLAAQIKLPQATVALDNAALVSAVALAGGADLTLTVAPVSYVNLSTIQKAIVRPNDLVFSIQLMSGTQALHNYSGTATVSVPYAGEPPVAVWYIDDTGALEKLSCTFDPVTKTVTFKVNHFSFFVVGPDGGIKRIRLTIGVLSYTVDGLAKTLDAAPVIVDGRTMVPLRFVAEALGAKVEWDGDTQTVSISLDGKTLTVTIGELAPGMDVPAMISNDRTMAPLRYISETLGCVVEWSANIQSVDIIKLEK